MSRALQAPVAQDRWVALALEAVPRPSLPVLQALLVLPVLPARQVQPERPVAQSELGLG